MSELDVILFEKLVQRHERSRKRIEQIEKWERKLKYPSVYWTEVEVGFGKDGFVYEKEVKNVQ